MKEWYSKAIDLFYNQHKQINEIANVCGKDRKTISRVLQKEEPIKYREEKEYRKKYNQEKNKEKNKEIKRKWWNENKGVNNGNYDTDYENLRRIQRQDAVILSRGDTVRTASILGSLSYVQSAYIAKNGNYLRKDKIENKNGVMLVPTSLPKTIRVTKQQGNVGGRRRTKGGTSNHGQNVNYALNIIR